MRACEIIPTRAENANLQETKIKGAQADRLHVLPHSFEKAINHTLARGVCREDNGKRGAGKNGEEML